MSNYMGNPWRPGRPGKGAARQTTKGEIGIAADREIAMLQTLLDSDGWIERATLRALLPAGSVRPVGLAKQTSHTMRGSSSLTRNAVSEKFTHKLHRWAADGLIVRTDNHVAVRDRAAVQARIAELQEQLPPPTPPKKTIAELEAEIRARKEADA